MTALVSSYAKQVPGVRNPKDARIRKPWGHLLHTTGGGVTAFAKKHGQQPIDVALRVYIDSQNGSNGYMWGGPAFVIDHNGTIYQIAPENALTAHAGGGNRAAYLDGSWTTKVSWLTQRAWFQLWPNYKHPYALFPSRSPNVDYVGTEMIPVGDGFGGPPMRPGLRFTLAQHDAAIVLSQDLGIRHAWPAGWAQGSRLLGHEDVDPINRSDAGGGWDPGFMRAHPYFDLRYVREGLK